MSTSHIPRLRAIPSTGPVDPMDNDASTPCGGCQRITQQGQLIVKYRGAWWHQSCADMDVSSGNVKAAWLALGHDLARSPRSYRVGESRAIVGALLGMIHDPDEDEVFDGEVAS